jgi:hypothetical protein
MRQDLRRAKLFPSLYSAHSVSLRLRSNEDWRTCMCPARTMRPQTSTLVFHQLLVDEQESRPKDGDAQGFS